MSELGFPPRFNGAVGLSKLGEDVDIGFDFCQILFARQGERSLGQDAEPHLRQLPKQKNMLIPFTNLAPRNFTLFFESTTGQIAREADVRFPYYFRTDIKKGLGCEAKSLISINILVGGASFELATPAV